jgi:hypothetical protein
MKKRCYVILRIAVLGSLLTAASVQAQSRPVQLGLFTPVQIVPEDESIGGFRLSLIYCRNTSVSGIDLGFIVHTTEGLSQGFQWGLVGLNEADFTGWQYCAVNVTQSDCEGLQLGIVNYANSMSGVQLGLVNYAANMKGIQIGLVNMIREGGAFPVFPIVNWSF